MRDTIFGGILGLAVGDALGVPVEFCARTSLMQNPVTDMRGHGTYDQPKGTWSDDTSMTLCLMDSLGHGLDYEDMMKRYADWLENGNYTPHGIAFDVGGSTKRAIRTYLIGASALSCGGKDEYACGNGSLMRILPLVFYLRAHYGSDFIGDAAAMETIHDTSRVTHAHVRCLIACGFYCAIAAELCEKRGIEDAIARGAEKARAWYGEKEEYADELRLFERIGTSLAKLPAHMISSSGYVLDTLEAALWCLLTTDSYASCVLKAVNLGQDADTTAAVAGGLAGIFYGAESIPPMWLEKLVKRSYIEDMCAAFAASI